VDPTRDPLGAPALPLREEVAPPEVKERLAGPLPDPPKGLAPPPAACAAFVLRKPASGKPAADKDAALGALAKALAEGDLAKRDALLVALEPSRALPAGFVRALRAELAPHECADALVLPILAGNLSALSPAVDHALYGLALAARLARTVPPLPKLAPPFDKKKVLEFLRGPVTKWFQSEAVAIEELGTAAAKLEGYGKGIAAIEAGTADLRLVEAMRNLPMPDSFRKDPELKAVYEASLEQALLARRERGRDGALVGFVELANVGALKDDRLTRVRRLLGDQYAGRRIDALDELTLPPLAAAPAARVEERIAAALPTFYAGLLFDGEPDEGLARALLERGLSWGARSSLRASGKAPLLLARGRFALGQLYWRAVDFDEALAALKKIPEGAAAGAPGEAELLQGLALALREGPETAAQMMLHPPARVFAVGNTARLDAIPETGPVGPLAVLDAALLKRIAAPRAPDSAYWRLVAERFDHASRVLTDAKTKDLATHYRDEASAIAAAAAQ
jgi:hypothetical protein